MTDAPRFRIGVLISGQGANLQALIDAVHSGRLQARIECVIADRQAYGLQRAAEAGIPSFQFKRDEHLSENIHRILAGRVDLIVLAGFLSILSADFCKKWPSKIINLHPALLPQYGGRGFYGKRVHRTVIENGEKESGASVHYVTAGVDEGKIIAQQRLRLSPGETPDSLQQKIQRIEHALLVGTVQKIVAEKRSSTASQRQAYPTKKR